MQQSPGPGLRERKKAQTRERIHKQALRLFERQGFETTTIAEIAAAADVSPRTVFVHYPTKEDLVFGDIDGALTAFDAALRLRPPGVTTLQAIRSWLRHAATGWLEPDVALQLSLANEVPAIAGRKLYVAERFRAPLAAALASDLGAPADDLRVQMAAAAVTAGLLRAEALVGDHVRSTRSLPPTEQIDDLLDRVEHFIHSGLDAL
jgi:AcrR family transcriptional regulator